jgi:prephenate dehydrogenase
LRFGDFTFIIPRMSETSPQFQERSIVIVGVGLIGGSIAAAVRKRFPECEVIGVGRNEERLEQARQAGLLTSWMVDINKSTVPTRSLGVVCLPVHQIANAVTALLNANCEIVTDAGSVKASVYEALGPNPDERFVGSHPIAGSEQSGFEHADANLFENRLCVVTTSSPEDSTLSRVQRVVAFWKALGSSVYLMSPDEHDRVLALTSHLPHILASVAASCVNQELLTFTGTGYRDTTRIAAGSAKLWASILMGNSKHCVEAIEDAEEQLRRFRDSLTSGNTEALEQLWEAAAENRRKLSGHHSEPL